MQSRPRTAPSPGRPSFGPSLPAFPTCPRTLLSSLSRFPAAGPPPPSSQAAEAPPGSARGGGGQRLRLLPSSRGRDRGRGCVPRCRATFTRAGDCEGRGGWEGRKREKGGGGGLGRRGGTASEAAAATAPQPRRPGGGGKRLRAAAPRRGRGGLPLAAPQPPTTGLEAGASQSPRAEAVRGDVGGRGPGVWSGGTAGGGAGGGRGSAGEAWRVRSPLTLAGGGGFPAALQPSEVGGGVLRILAAPCPARGTGNPLASAGPATSVSFYDHNRCSGFKSRPGVWTAGISAAALQLPLMARSMCRKPQRQLRVASHAGPCPQLARPATPLRPSKSQPHPCGETKLSLGGRKRPAKLSRDSAFVRGNIEYAPKASQASTTSGFGGAVVELRWP